MAPSASPPITRENYVDYPGVLAAMDEIAALVLATLCLRSKVKTFKSSDLPFRKAKVAAERVLDAIRIATLKLQKGLLARKPISRLTTTRIELRDRLMKVVPDAAWLAEQAEATTGENAVQVRIANALTNLVTAWQGIEEPAQ